MNLHGCVNGKADDSIEVPDNNINEDELELILAGFFNEDIQGNSSMTSSGSIAQRIKQLEMREKVPIIEIPRPGSSKSNEPPAHFDVIKYWESQKFTNPELYRVAMIVLSSSATQVSVERGFSALKLMLSDRRMNLTGGSVENSLLLKLNPDLLPKISKMMSEAED